jgi:hypothetical protein
MKKKVSIETPTLEFEVRGEEVIFSAGDGPQFKIKTASLARLIAPGFLTRPPAENAKLDALAATDSLPAFVKMQRLLKQGFNADEGAKILGITPDVFRASVGRGVNRYAKDVQLIRDETERQSKAEGDYCKRKLGPRTEGQMIRGGTADAEFALVPAAKVKDALKAGQSVGEIARRFELDEKSFADWITAHAEILA